MCARSKYGASCTVGARLTCDGPTHKPSIKPSLACADGQKAGQQYDLENPTEYKKDGAKSCNLPGGYRNFGENEAKVAGYGGKLQKVT